MKTNRASGGGGREGKAKSQKSGGRGAAINGDAPRLPNGEEPEGGPTEVPGSGSRKGTRPRAFHPRRRDVRILPCSTQTRAPGDTFSV